MTKRDVYVEVFDGEQYDGSWPPEQPEKFMAWFQQWIDKIPVEYRAKASIEIESQGGYEDSHYARIKIFYMRKETDDEHAQRTAEEEQQQKNNTASKAKAERETYERLKKKFESS